MRAAAEIDEFVTSLVARFASDPSGVDHDQPLQLELEIDSLDFLTLMASIREHFGVVIPELEYPRVSTLRDLRAYLVDRVESVDPR